MKILKPHLFFSFILPPFPCFRPLPLNRGNHLKTLLLFSLLTATQTATADNGVPDRDRAGAWMKNTSVAFRENRGQVADDRGRTRPDILFTADVPGARIYLRKNGISTVFTKAIKGGARRGDSSPLPAVESSFQDEEIRVARMDMTLLGCNPHPGVRAEQQLGGVANFYLAHCPDGILDVKDYARVIYEDIYENIDLELISRNGKLKYTFIVRPGGDAGLIRMKYDGARSMSVARNGSLRIVTPIGRIEEEAPVSFMETGNTPVRSRYILSGNTISFEVGEYDKSAVLLIDPWATYYGGTQPDEFRGPILDNNGNVIVAGWTTSSNFPTLSAYQSSSAGDADAVLVKFKADGTRIWATYYGGSENDVAYGLDVDMAGNTVIAGVSSSSNLPVKNACQPTNHGLDDVLVAKFDANGYLLWGTYYGGSSRNYAMDVAVNTSGEVFVAGMTHGADFPLLNAYQATHGGGSTDGFLMKFNGDGIPQWATYYGGDEIDQPINIATDPAGNVCISGSTMSTNLPLINPFQAAYSGGAGDAFLAKYGSTGTLLWSTYLGGADLDDSRGVACDSSGNVYIAGYTNSIDFPTSGGVQNSIAGAKDIFLTKFDANGGRLWSTYFGGSADEMMWIKGLTTAGSGDVVMVGSTLSTDFPTVNPCRSNNAGNYDAAIVTFSSAGVLCFSTYFGGSGTDLCHGVAVDVKGNVVISGNTNSVDFPTKSAFQSTHSGGYDGFIAYLDCEAPAVLSQPSPQNVCEEGTVSFSVAAAPRFCMSHVKWQVSTNNGASWNDVPGETTDTLELAATRSMDGYRYRAVLTNSCGSATTSAALLTVTAPPSIAVHPKDSTVCEGTTAFFSVTAPGPSLKYRWQADTGNGFFDVDDPIFSGANSSRLSLSVSAISWNAARFRCIVSGPCEPPAVSAAALLTVLPKPFARATAMGPTDFCRGDSVVLRADTCSGCSYLWLRNVASVATGPAYTARATGRYRLVVISANGCSDSSDAVIISIYPSPDALISPAGPSYLCEGDSVLLATANDSGCVFQWRRDGSPITGASASSFTAGTAGVYSVIVTTAQGCTDTSIGTSVNILPLPSARILGPSSICPNSIVTYRVDKPAGLNFAWSVSGGTPLSPQDRDSIVVNWTSTGSGTVRVRLTDAATGCAKDTALQVTIENTLSPVIISSRPPVICEGDSVTLDAGAGYVNYLWSTGAVTQAITVKDSGTYYVTVRDANGCSGTSQPFRVTLRPRPLPVVTALGSTTFCEGDSVSLDAGPGYASHQWNSGEDSRIIVVKAAGSYSVTVTDTAGCSGTSAPVVITVVARPDARITGPSTVCLNTEAAFSVAGGTGYTYAWSAGRGVIQYGAGTERIRARWNSEGSDTVRVSVRNADGCARDSLLVVSVQASLRPVVTASGSLSFCEGDSVTFDAGPGYASYLWNSGESTRFIVVNMTGSYSVTVTDSNGCSGTSDPVSVVVFPRPEPVITGRTEICEGDSARLDAEAGYLSYLWNGGATIPYVIVRSAGMYSVTVTDSNGCTGTATADVIVHPRPAPVITENAGVLQTIGALSYQWFRDGVPVPGAVNRAFAPVDSGAYTVFVTDSNGCSALSPPFFFALSRVSTTLELLCAGGEPMPPGAGVILPIRLTASTRLTPDAARTLSITLRFNSTVLAPDFHFSSSRIEGNDRIVSIEAPRDALMTQGTLAELPFTVLLGDAPCTSVRIDSMRWTDGTAAAALVNAECEICAEVCREGGTRLFRQTPPAYLRTRPNPFNASTIVEYGLIERGTVSLIVLDRLGRRVATLMEGEAQAGEHTVRFEAKDLPSGVYLAVLITPGRVLSAQMILAR